MDIDKIRHLLDKYYNGETDAGEEKLLEDYFLHNDIPEEFAVDKEVFHHLSSAKNDAGFRIPEGMEQRLSDSIDVLEKQSKSHTGRGYTMLYRYISGIAAAALLVIGISVLLPNGNDDRTAMKDTFDNPEEAYKATESALKLFADAFNKGQEQMDKAKNATLSVKEKIDNIKNFRK